MTLNMWRVGGFLMGGSLWTLIVFSIFPLSAGPVVLSSVAERPRASSYVDPSTYPSFFGPLDDQNKGSTFIYYPPAKDAVDAGGLLRPVMDPRLRPDEQIEYFWPEIVSKGRVAGYAAFPLQEKREQLLRLHSFDGPRFRGFVIFPSTEALQNKPAMMIRVEHIDGRPVYRHVARRFLEEKIEYFNLFLKMYQSGFVPLDFRYANLFWTSEGTLRPVDVTLMTRRELISLKSRDKNVYMLRMLQLAESARALTRDQTDALPQSAQCVQIVNSLMKQFRRSRPLFNRMMRAED